MIHIIRDSETIEDIAYIYDIGKESILNHNPDASGRANSALWVDAGGLVSFDEITKRATLHPCCGDIGFNLSVVYKADCVENSFVSVDNWAGNCSQVYIEGYGEDDQTGELILPCDYPAINACLINNITPSFALRELNKYVGGDMLDMLLTDLSFKEYRNVMLIAQNYNEYTAALELKKIFIGEGFGIALAGEYNVLRRAESLEGFRCIYYMTEKNIIDFDSFAYNVSDLADRVGTDGLGVLYTPRCADINKTTSQINYMSLKEVNGIIESTRTAEINFDEDSQLCWIRYTSRKGEVHSLLFEDIRTFYAKSAFLKEKQVKNICLTGCDAYTNTLGKILKIVK